LLTFLIFFAVVLGLHNVPLPWRIKKFNLLGASYVFYAPSALPFVLLMLSTLVDSFAAKCLYVARTPARQAFLETLNYACRPRFRNDGVSADTGRLFPEKLVKYFIAPVKRVNDGTYRLCNELGLGVLAKCGVHPKAEIENLDKPE
jgi:hypothetical protein